jgi:hypothetical protein
MTRTLLEKEKRLLRVLYDLSQVYIEVTPTMVSDAMGFTCCARIVDARKNLEAQKYLTIRHVSRGRAILKLTKAGAELAKTLEKASFLGRGSIRKNKVSPAYLISPGVGIRRNFAMRTQIYASKSLTHICQIKSCI